MSAHDWEEVNDVLSRLIDSADGYENAAENAQSGRFLNLFRNKAQQRRQFVAELRSEIIRAGGQPEDDGTLLAGAHRMFVDLRAKLSDDDEAVLEEIERGEKKLIEEYRDALGEVPAGGDLHRKLSEQLATVERDLARVRSAEDALD